MPGLFAARLKSLYLGSPAAVYTAATEARRAYHANWIIANGSAQLKFEANDTHLQRRIPGDITSFICDPDGVVKSWTWIHRRQSRSW